LTPSRSVVRASIWSVDAERTRSRRKVWSVLGGREIRIEITLPRALLSSSKSIILRGEGVDAAATFDMVKMEDRRERVVVKRF
jgi:hypothetical protein